MLSTNTVYKRVLDAHIVLTSVATAIYLEAKAEEVWVCDKDGKLTFYNKQGKLANSLLLPDFPKQIRRRNQPAP